MILLDKQVEMEATTLPRLSAFLSYLLKLKFWMLASAVVNIQTHLHWVQVC